MRARRIAWGIGVVVVLAAAVAAGLLAGRGHSAGADAGRTIQVVGSGKVNGTPDTLTLQLSVSTNAASAATALSRNDAEMGTLQARLERSGVPAKDLATSGLELTPNYTSDGTISGYGVDDDLVVTLTDLARAGATIDAAQGAVGNDVRINGLTLSLSDSSGLLQTARKDAMADAHRAALALASASGARLGEVEKITDDEQVANPPPPWPELGAAASTGAGGAVPVQAGSEQISDQVTVVYGLES